jgi:hypothetical protein
LFILLVRAAEKTASGIARIERTTDGVATKGTACTEESTAGVLLVVLRVATERISSSVVVGRVVAEKATASMLLAILLVWGTEGTLITIDEVRANAAEETSAAQVAVPLPPFLRLSSNINPFQAGHVW